MREGELDTFEPNVEARPMITEKLGRGMANREEASVTCSLELEGLII